MFNQLFFRSDALTRQLSAPLVDERRQYLAECASQGMSRKSLRAKSLILLSIVEHLRLGHRPKDQISLAEIKEAARRWSRHNWPSASSPYVKRSRAYFIKAGGCMVDLSQPSPAQTQTPNSLRSHVDRVQKLYERRARSFPDNGRIPMWDRAAIPQSIA